MTQKPIIQFQGVSVGYTHRLALCDISLEVIKGEFIGITGPNGSGKSTLFKTILGLLKPMKGTVRVFNEDPFRMPKIRSKIGYLPQRELIDHRFPILVKEAVLMGRYSSIGLLKRPIERDEEIAFDALRLVEMEELANEPLGHLSGGQQQRVLIARALAQEPEIMLLDEPTTGIDSATQIKIMDIIRRIHLENGTTILLITHNANGILPHVDRLFYIKDKELQTCSGLGGVRC